MTDLLELAGRAEQADGLLAGEVTAQILREAFKLIWPMPSVRVPHRADGSPWGGDGLGPYTEEYKAWDRRWSVFDRLIKAGAFLDSAMSLVPEGWQWAASSDGNASMFQMDTDQRVFNPQTGSAATTALALVAAALRALSEGSPK